MDRALSENMCTTLVRHQFYRKIDWEFCEQFPKDQREREFRIVIQKLISGDASELSLSAKRELEESLVSEVSEFGTSSMAKYAKVLNPPTSVSKRVLRWALEPVQAFLAWQHRKDGIRFARTQH